MSNVAIRVENLSKLYRIGGKQEKYATLRDTIVDMVAAPYRRVRGLLRGEAASGLTEEIWALKDISFEVKHGEVVGIIGRNGAGKSTLLKILSRITEPTTGYADVYGRVGALLEVGTGFHPELTGRENVFLNGAILGMSREDIKRKFDEIVDFAGVEKFIDTPVKHYSSGMGLRLGFAVAAHLEPEILIVDEVLAVGDAEFQKKCLGKMSDVAGEGRTVLFVSHNMAAVQGLCHRGVVLDYGTVRFESSAENAVDHYLKSRSQLTTQTIESRTDRRGSGRLRFVEVSTADQTGEAIETIFSGQTIYLRMHFRIKSPITSDNLLIAFNVNEHSHTLMNLNSYDTDHTSCVIESDGYFECEWPNINLAGGTYSCTIYCAIDGIVADWLEDAFELHIVDGDYFGTGRVLKRSGKVLVHHKWRTISRSTVHTVLD